MNIYDLIIIGAGPAGISAGIYAGRGRVNTLIIEKEGIGGQINSTNELVNYPGIRSTTGPHFMEEMKKQALDFGVKFKSAEVKDVLLDEEVKVIKTESEELRARAVIVATGASPRKAGFKGETEYTGRGVAYCATCDAELFKNLEVFVVGAGYAAAEEAIYLTKFARKVTIIARGAEFKCAKTIVDKVNANPKIEVRFNTEILEVGGEGLLGYAKFVDRKSNETYTYNVNKEDGTFGIFVFAGYIPQTNLFKDKLEVDNKGYLVTNENMETNIKGVYVAGDVRPKELRQVVTAVSDGAIAATFAEKYITNEKERLGIKDDFKEDIKVEKEVPSTLSAKKRSSLLTDELRSQLKDIFSKVTRKVNIVTFVDEGVEKSLELRDLVLDLAELSENIQVNVYKKGENRDLESKVNLERIPMLAILDESGDYTGVKFSGVPGGHELNSLILSIYNLGGPGQSLDENILSDIKAINKKVNIKVAVSLSCHLCPDVVTACHRMAIENRNIESEMINVGEFEDIKSKYKIMSVPCIIVDNKEVYFGAKKVSEIVALIKK